MEIETIKITRPECPGGYCIINKADLKDDDVVYGEEVKSITQKGPLSRKVMVK